MLHGNSLRKFSQHPLLEVLKTLVVITTTDKLLVLQKEDSGTPRELVLSPQPNFSTQTCHISDFPSESLNKSKTLWIFGGSHICLFPCQLKEPVLTLCCSLLRRLYPDGTSRVLYLSCLSVSHEGEGRLQP